MVGCLHPPTHPPTTTIPTHPHLGNVVADVIHHVHVQVVGRGVEHLGKGLATEKGHAAAVDPRVVGGAGHGGQVVLALLRGAGGAWAGGGWGWMGGAMHGGPGPPIPGRGGADERLAGVGAAQMRAQREGDRPARRGGHTCELMRAQASWRSLVTMPSRAIAFSIATSASVATWHRQAGCCAEWQWWRVAAAAMVQVAG